MLNAGFKYTMLLVLLFTVIKGHAQKELTFKIHKKYLNIPIQTSENRQRVNLYLNDEKLTYNDIRIAHDEVNY